MTRCRICGGADCPSCNPPQRPQATAGDIFDSLLASTSEIPQRAANATETPADRPPESVWVSSRLDYFRGRAGAWPDDIGFHGCGHPRDGAYRRLDQFWLAWLRSRVEGLAGFQKAQGRARLREIVIETINAGSLPEALDDFDHWPRIYPAGYGPPDSPISTKFWPMGIDDFGGVA